MPGKRPKFSTARPRKNRHKVKARLARFGAAWEATKPHVAESDRLTLLKAMTDAVCATRDKDDNYRDLDFIPDWLAKGHPALLPAYIELRDTLYGTTRVSEASSGRARKRPSPSHTEHVSLPA
jgi:hypothetical protein